MVRYADDAVSCFANEQDARRVMEVLPRRLERFGLELNEHKTRLVAFRPEKPDPYRSSGSRPWGEHAFDFLGFTHFWQRSLSGRWVVARRTAKGRFGRALKRVDDGCRRNRHRSLAAQQLMLNRMLTGHYGYFGIIGNTRALGRFLYEVRRRWRYWLDRRTNRARMPWGRFASLLSRYPLATPSGRIMR